jgi:CHAT domain-containing protein
MPGESAEVVKLPRYLPELQNALHQPFHILHYDGHAGFDPVKNQGFLVMCDEKNRRKDVYAETLATFLNNTSIRLVVLTACKTAEDASLKRYAGLAQQLMVRNNLPAVIAMQFDIIDDAAIAFIQVSTVPWRWLSHRCGGGRRPKRS